MSFIFAWMDTTTRGGPMAGRQPHELERAGSIPAPATNLGLPLKPGGANPAAPPTNTGINPPNNTGGVPAPPTYSDNPIPSKVGRAAPRAAREPVTNGAGGDCRCGSERQHPSAKAVLPNDCACIVKAPGAAGQRRTGPRRKKDTTAPVNASLTGGGSATVPPPTNQDNHLPPLQLRSGGRPLAAAPLLTTPGRQGRALTTLPVEVADGGGSEAEAQRLVDEVNQIASSLLAKQPVHSSHGMETAAGPGRVTSGHGRVGSAAAVPTGAEACPTGGVR